MTRIDPDSVFAAAAQAELQRRVRAHQRPGAARMAANQGVRRPSWFAELAIAAGVVVVIAAVLAAFATLRAPNRDAAAPARTSATTPSATGPVSPRLIGPAGAKERSDADIRNWAAPLKLGSIWTEQAVLDTHCMAKHGFLYDPIFEYSANTAENHAGLPQKQWQDFQVALYGPETTAAYDWRTAGCHGLSVHQTGQDANH